MYFLHTVKNSQSNFLQRFPSLLAAHIAFADILGAGDNILFKIMLRQDNFILLRIFIRHTIAQSHTRSPKHLCIHHFNDTLKQHIGYVKQVDALLRHIEYTRQFLRCFLPCQLH